ncbi:MAG: DNA repair protein RecO [Firmicutes bacterium]|nr:DNA repair protein RecO [Bacillota bacterium]
MYEKTEGIVLRETEYKDSDKLLTVLTREHGKLTLRARGVKSGRSRSKAACQLLTYSEFTVSEKQGKYTITEAVVKEMFPELREDIELLYLASYFAQVTDAVAQEEDASPELLSLLLNALYALAKLKKPQMLVKAAFELRLACIAGFLPDLRGCAVCGNPNPNRFNVTQGILQCAECRSDMTDGIRMPVSKGSLAAMRYIASADPKRLFSFSLSDGTLQELNGLTESYLTMRLERGFFTLDLYKSLFI